LLAVFNVNTIFEVDADTYAGRRFVLLLFGTGIVIVNVASASGPVYCAEALAVGAGRGSAALCDPPPHAAREAAAVVASTEETILFPRRFIGTNPQPPRG
jgi:hypothetical protein